MKTPTDPFILNLKSTQLILKYLGIGTKSGNLEAQQIIYSWCSKLKNICEIFDTLGFPERVDSKATLEVGGVT